MRQLKAQAPDVGPQANTKTQLQTQDGRSLRPNPASDQIADQAVIDANFRAHGTHGPISDRIAETERDLANALSGRIGTRAFRPTRAQVAGSRTADPSGSAHVRNLEPSAGPIPDEGGVSSQLTPETDGCDVLESPYVGFDHHLERLGASLLESLINYRPRDLSDERWTPIERFVKEVMALSARLERQSPISDIGVVTKFVDWLHNRHGYPLEMETIFTAHHIVAYTETVNEPGISKFTMQNRRSVLLRIAEEVNPASVVLLPPVKRKGSVHPYTDNEIAAIHSRILGKRSTEMRRSGLLTLALGAGAGLAAGDIRFLKIGHILDTDDGVVIQVPDLPTVEFPRRIAPFADWEKDIRAALIGMEADDWAITANAHVRDNRMVSDFTATLAPGLTMQRLRATWLVRHLNLGTPPIILRDAYGARSLEALSRYIAWAKTPNEATRMLHLRGQAANR